jgi:hypothetical protein
MTPGPLDRRVGEDVTYRMVQWARLTRFDPREVVTA